MSKDYTRFIIAVQDIEIAGNHPYFCDKGEEWGIVSTLISSARKSAPVRTSLSSPAERNQSSQGLPHPPFLSLFNSVCI
jgi:hypothetical protein